VGLKSEPERDLGHGRSLGFPPKLYACPFNMSISFFDGVLLHIYYMRNTLLTRRSKDRTSAALCGAPTALGNKNPMERPTPFAAVVFHGCKTNRGLPSGTAELHAREPGYRISNSTRVHDTPLQRSGNVGADDRTIQEISGHTDGRSVERCARMTNRAAVEMLRPKRAAKRLRGAKHDCN
jgi:hypothetical protein